MLQCMFVSEISEHQPESCVFAELLNFAAIFGKNVTFMLLTVAIEVWLTMPFGLDFGFLLGLLGHKQLRHTYQSLVSATVLPMFDSAFILL